MFVSKIYEISDRLLYDNCSTDKSNNYSKTTGITISHSTDHYVIQKTSSDGTSTNYARIGLQSLETTNYEYEIDIIRTASNNQYTGMGIGMTNLLTITDNGSSNENGVDLGEHTGSKGLYYKLNGVFNGNSRTTPKFSNNVNYNFRIIVNGTSIRGIVTNKDNNSTVYDSTITVSSLTDWHIPTIHLFNVPSTINVSKISIKPL